MRSRVADRGSPPDAGDIQGQGPSVLARRRLLAGGAAAAAGALALRPAVASADTTDIAHYSQAGTFTQGQTIQPSSDQTALALIASSTQFQPLLTANTGGRSAPQAQFVGADIGNGSRYMTQIGGAGSSQPFVVTNCFMTINGRTNEPYDGSSLAIAGEQSYMLGISSDVGESPVMVLQGGNSGPLLRGYNYGGTKVVDVNASGQLQLPIATGSSAGLVLGGDANLYRWAAHVLRTDSSLYAPTLASDSQAAGSAVLHLRRSGDQYARFYVNTDGQQYWGPGSGGVDATIYRAAAKQLKTDQRFVCGDGVATKEINTSGLSSAQIDAQFQTTPGNGTVVSDPTNGLILVRQNGKWVKSPVATVIS